MRCQLNITNEQTSLHVDEDRLRAAVQAVLSGESVQKATIGVAIVDDATIHAYNREHLDHDYPTDVLSFPLERDAASVEGEIMVSAETAAAVAQRVGWPADDELLLYVVHGLLHLVGYDDHDPTDQAQMRERESHYLGEFGLQLCHDADQDESVADAALHRAAPHWNTPGERP